MPAARSPIIYVIAGPNGAGKTTFARKFLPSQEIEGFLNADLIAAGLSPLRPQAMAARASRILLSRWRELVKSKVDFAFESTLSGRTYATMLRDAKVNGYSVRICYLWLPDVKLSLRRVRQRVRKGGHDVPEADIRRRFLPSLRNLFSLYLPLADEVLMFQAAVHPPQLVARWKGPDRVILIPQVYACIQEQAAPTETC
jgi:predicted ABC-type ATPase